MDVGRTTDPRWVLAVDHGTTATIGAVADVDPGDGWVRVATVIVDGTTVVPSVVLSRPDGTVLSGRPALDAAPSDPAAAVLRSRSFLASATGGPDDAVLTTWPRPTTAVDAATALIARVFHTEAARRGTLPELLVLLHPASWGEPAREALRSAGRAVLDAASGGAGANGSTPALLATPEAAAIRLGGNGPVLVVDVGGGGTEIAVVDREATGGATVRPGARMLDVGGEALDDALAQTVLDRAHPDLATRIRFGGDLDAHRAWFVLRSGIRSAKERLGAEGTVAVSLPVLPPESPEPGTVTLTHTDLGSLFAPGLEEIAKAVLDVLAGLEDPTPPPMLVRGGVTGLPGVRDWLAQRTGLALATDGDAGPVAPPGAASGASAWGAAQRGLGRG